MEKAIHTLPRFSNEDAARQYLETLRWPNGAVCPHCSRADRQSKLHGKSHRAGLYSCGHCRGQYTVTVGTELQRSKVGLHKWVYGTHLMCASTRGVSAKQLERVLGVAYKTAWCMARSIREARSSDSARKPPAEPAVGRKTKLGFLNAGVPAPLSDFNRALR